MPPLDFIGLAEETGLILPIGRWVLAEACRTLKAWRFDPLTAHLGIAVNVSARQLREGDFVQQVRALLYGHGIRPGQLKLEITESMLVDDIEQTIATMRALRTWGSALRSMISVRAIRPCTTSSACRSTRSRSTSPLCATFWWIRTTRRSAAPWWPWATAWAWPPWRRVETPAQWTFLANERCDGAQGYLYARPMPVDELLAWLRQRSAAVS